MTREEFSDLLVKCRNNDGCGKNEICRRTGLTFNQVQRIERAENSYSMDKAIKYLSVISHKIFLINNTKKFNITKLEDINRWVARARSLKNITQIQLAIKTQCTRETIANAELGKCEISVDIFLRLVDALEYKIIIKNE